MSTSGGASLPGATGQDDVSRRVRRMFNSVACRYDLVNHLLSFNVDRWWRRRTVQRVQPVLSRPGARVLDLCCGTGDLLAALAGHASGPVWGCDFSRPMLTIAHAKLEASGARVGLIEADAMRLPLPDASIDLITIAFGFRNLVDYRAGLEEMRRVLRPGGLVAILEFSTPGSPLFGALYRFYSRRLLPAIGGALSGDRDAYAYLPDSVRRFPGAEELAALMRLAGFQEVSYGAMTGGIVALHLGWR